MRVVLTEDGGSGFQFWKAISTYVFDGTLAVYSTAYGSTNAKAGNTSFYRAIQALYRDGKIDSDTKLVLAADTMQGTSKSMDRAVRDFNNHIASCVQLLKKELHINYRFTDYICWEELFLSFKYLLEFVPTDYNDYTEEMIKYAKNRGIFTSEVRYICDLLLYFGVPLGKCKSLERGMAELLTEITQDRSTPQGVYKFEITKSKLGDCWFRNCIQVNPNTPCVNSCKVVNASKKQIPLMGKDKFLFVVNNSKIKRMCRAVMAF